MDIQKIIDESNNRNARVRGKYHLTYGDLLKALKESPSDAVFDERIVGIGSWRGSYTEIALYTMAKGFYAEKEEFNDYGGDNFQEKYKAWEKENVVSRGKLPRNANELAKVLESLIGLQFVGYKGGNFTIAEWKPLWLEQDHSTYNTNAIIGIDENLRVIVKSLSEEEG